MSGNGPRNSRMKAGPATDAGKSLTAQAPARQPWTISVGVKAPGNAGTPRSAAHVTRAAVRVRHDEESGTGVQGARRGLDVEHGAGTHQQLLAVARRDRADALEGVAGCRA